MLNCVIGFIGIMSFYEYTNGGPFFISSNMLSAITFSSSGGLPSFLLRSNSSKRSTHLIDCLLESILVSPFPPPKQLENPEHTHLQRVEFPPQSPGETQLFPVSRRSPANSTRNRSFPRVGHPARPHRHLLGLFANPNFGPKRPA